VAFAKIHYFNHHLEILEWSLACDLSYFLQTNRSRNSYWQPSGVGVGYMIETLWVQSNCLWQLKVCL